MRKAFATLGSDDTPMVRRAAAKWLGVSDDRVLSFSGVTDMERAPSGLCEKIEQTARPFRRSGSVQETSVGRPGLCSTFDRGRSYRDRPTTDAGRGQGTAVETDQADRVRQELAGQIHGRHTLQRGAFFGSFGLVDPSTFFLTSWRRLLDRTLSAKSWLGITSNF